MAILSLRNFGIVLIAQVALGIPWSAKPAARYEGYDLERGPVLYEAYYPEEEDVEIKVPNGYQEKRYFDRITVPERSYQLSADPYEIPYESQESEFREEYVRPNSEYLSAFTAARPQTVQKTGYVGNNEGRKEYIFSDQPLSEQLKQNQLKSSMFNDYSIAGSESSDFEDESEEEASDYVEQNSMNFGVEDVQRIVPIDDEFIFGEPPVKNIPDFKESFKNSIKKEIFDGQNFGVNYNQQKEIQPLPVMENIFEPRPQTINYIFSTPKKLEKLKSVDLESDSEDNDWPRNYGDNLIQAEIKKEDERELQNQEAKIASIEVSQVPHHKIRHHHGERPKRKYIH